MPVSQDLPRKRGASYPRRLPLAHRSTAGTASTAPPAFAPPAVARPAVARPTVAPACGCITCGRPACLLVRLPRRLNRLPDGRLDLPRDRRVHRPRGPVVHLAGPERWRGRQGQRRLRQRRRARNHPAAAREEHRLTVPVERHPHPALVHEPVMPPAQQHRVGQTRLPAVGPVPDMMRLGEPAPAARVPAAPVPLLQRPAEVRRDGPRLPPHADHLTPPVQHRDQRRIARHAPRRLGAHPHPVELRPAPLAVLLQRGHLRVHRHLVPLCPRPAAVRRLPRLLPRVPRPQPRRQRPLGDQSDRIGPALAAPWPRFRVLGAVQRVVRGLDGPHQHGPGLGLEPPPHHVRPVHVDEDRERAAPVPGLFGPDLAVARQVPHLAHHPFQRRGRALVGVVEQLALGLGRGHPGEGPRLGVGEPPGLHPGRGLREILERMRDPHVLAAGGEGAPGPPGEPLGAGVEGVGPPLAAVELGDEGEHLVGGDVDPGGEFGDALSELDGVHVILQVQVRQRLM